jgi:hypothetical protein
MAAAYTFQISIFKQVNVDIQMDMRHVDSTRRDDRGSMTRGLVSRIACWRFLLYVEFA